MLWIGKLSGRLHDDHQESFLPSLMHTRNYYLSDVGSEKAESIVVPKISGLQNGTLTIIS